MLSKNRIARVPRAPSFDEETLKLFVALEERDDRDSAEYRQKSKQLAALLGLSSEWLCSVCDVNDPDDVAPTYNELVRKDWLKVRAVRLALLRATSEQRQQEASLALAD